MCSYVCFKHFTFVSHICIVVIFGSHFSFYKQRKLIITMNRNTVTTCVPLMNVIDSQSSVHSVAHHLPPPPIPQSSLISTNGSCHSGSSTNTTNSLNSHSSSCGSGSSPLENLPKKFVSSMRTLFDIMDGDKRTGFVRLSDIEARWQDDGSKGMPTGVIDCLRRVTPVSGMLSFERFCAGLKICLLRNQANECRTSIESNSNSNNIITNNKNNQNNIDSNNINNSHHHHHHHHSNHSKNILASTTNINGNTNKTIHTYV